MTDPLVDAKIAEAAHAAAIAHEANANAREVQMYDVMFKAFHDIVTGGDEDNKILLLQRVPVLCKDVAIIKNNIWWIMTIGGGIGGTILLGIGYLALKGLGV